MSVHNESRKYSASLKGKFLPDTPTSEYGYTSSGESHSPGPMKGEYLGYTKGNTDLPINRTEGVKSGVGDPLGAGGKGKMSYPKKGGMDYS